MKKHFLLGLAAGVAAGAAAAIAAKTVTDKVVDEIKSGLEEVTFTSPEGNNFVTVSFGSSDTAKGLTYVKVKAYTEGSEDNCKLVVLTKKVSEPFIGDWADNDSFKLLVGNGKCKQCCDVKFNGENLLARYYLVKESCKVKTVEECVEEAFAEEAAEVIAE